MATGASPGGLGQTWGPLLLVLFLGVIWSPGNQVVRLPVHMGTGGHLDTRFVSWSVFPSSQDYFFHSSVLSVPEGRPRATAIVSERQEVPLLPHLRLPDLPGTLVLPVTWAAWQRDQPHPAQAIWAVSTHFKWTCTSQPRLRCKGQRGEGEKDPRHLSVGQKGGPPGYLLSLSLHPMCMLMCAQGKGWAGEGLVPDLSVVAGDAALP